MSMAPEAITMKTVDAFEDVPEGHNVMSIPDVTGDTRSIWNPNDVADVEMARTQFDAAKAKGMTAFRVDGTTGEKGQVMRDFDPEAGKIIFVKQLQGG